jgi:hypothetical protein
MPVFLGITEIKGLHLDGTGSPYAFLGSNHVFPFATGGGNASNLIQLERGKHLEMARWDEEKQNTFIELNNPVNEVKIR